MLSLFSLQASPDPLYVCATYSFTAKQCDSIALLGSAGALEATVVVRTRGLGAHHDQRRRDIAAAVLAVVAERGLPAVSLSTVAAQAGVSSGRVQYYFPTKEALLEAAFDHVNAESSARITAKLGSEPESAPPRQALTVILTELIPYDAPTLSHLRIRQSFAALALHHDSIAERMRTEYERLHHRDIPGLLRRDQVAGRLSETVDPTDATMKLVALAEGLAYYVLIGLCLPDIAQDYIVGAISDLYDAD